MRIFEAASLAGLLTPMACACRPNCEETKYVDRASSFDGLAAVEEAHDVFLDLLDPSYDVCIRKIKLRDVRSIRPLSGKYDPVTKNIVYYGTQAADPVIWHEMGHALQMQNGLALPREFDAIPWSAQDDDSYHNVESEPFARAMEYAPSYSQLLGEACSSDTSESDALRSAASYFVDGDERYISDTAWEALERSVFFVPDGELLVGSEGELIWSQVEGTSIILSTDGGPIRLADESTLEGSRAVGSLAVWDGGRVWAFDINGPSGSIAATRWFHQGQDGRFSSFGCVGDRDYFVASDGMLLRVSWADRALTITEMIPSE